VRFGLQSERRAVPDPRCAGDLSREGAEKRAVTRGPAKRSRHRAPVHHRFGPAILEPAEFQASARDEDVSRPSWLALSC